MAGPDRSGQQIQRLGEHFFESLQPHRAAMEEPAEGGEPGQEPDHDRDERERNEQIGHEPDEERPAHADQHHSARRDANTRSLDEARQPGAGAGAGDEAIDTRQWTLERMFQHRLADAFGLDLLAVIADVAQPAIELARGEHARQNGEGEIPADDRAGHDEEHQ